MKYIQSRSQYKYNKIFESSNTDLTKYYIKKKYWPYELGYIWSPNHRTHSVYRDPSVSLLQETRDGMTGSLISTSLGFLFKEYTGASSLKELCSFHPNRTDSELQFLLENPLEERYYALVENPADNKNIVVKQLDSFGKLENYRDIIRDVLGKDYTDEEINNDGCGSWHVTVKLHEHNGIKYLVNNLSGTPQVICLRSDIEKILDMTDTCNYYNFEDKYSQIVRIRDKEIFYDDTYEMFYDLRDNHQMELVDMSWTGINQLMLQFKRPNIHMTDEMIKEIQESVMRFNRVNNCNLSMIRVSRNPGLFMRERDQDFIANGRPVYGYPITNIAEIEKIESLSGTPGVGTVDITKFEHSFYFLFDI